MSLANSKKRAASSATAIKLAQELTPAAKTIQPAVPISVSIKPLAVSPLHGEVSSPRDGAANDGRFLMAGARLATKTLDEEAVKSGRDIIKNTITAFGAALLMMFPMLGLAADIIKKGSAYFVHTVPGDVLSIIAQTIQGKEGLHGAL